MSLSFCVRGAPPTPAKAAAPRLPPALVQAVMEARAPYAPRVDSLLRWAPAAPLRNMRPEPSPQPAASASRLCPPPPPKLAATDSPGLANAFWRTGAPGICAEALERANNAPATLTPKLLWDLNMGAASYWPDSDVPIQCKGRAPAPSGALVRRYVPAKFDHDGAACGLWSELGCRTRWLEEYDVLDLGRGDGLERVDTTLLTAIDVQGHAAPRRGIRSARVEKGRPCTPNQLEDVELAVRRRIDFFARYAIRLASLRFCLARCRD